MSTRLPLKQGNTGGNELNFIRESYFEINAANYSNYIAIFLPDNRSSSLFQEGRAGVSGLRGGHGAVRGLPQRQVVQGRGQAGRPQSRLQVRALQDVRL